LKSGSITILNINGLTTMPIDHIQQIFSRYKQSLLSDLFLIAMSGEVKCIASNVEWHRLFFMSINSKHYIVKKTNLCCCLPYPFKNRLPNRVKGKEVSRKAATVKSDGMNRQFLMLVS
jgi:hypothetical protein